MLSQFKKQQLEHQWRQRLALDSNNRHDARAQVLALYQKCDCFAEAIFEDLCHAIKSPGGGDATVGFEQSDPQFLLQFPQLVLVVKRILSSITLRMTIERNREDPQTGFGDPIQKSRFDMLRNELSLESQLSLKDGQIVVESALRPAADLLAEKSSLQELKDCFRQHSSVPDEVLFEEILAFFNGDALPERLNSAITQASFDELLWIALGILNQLRPVTNPISLTKTTKCVEAPGDFVKLLESLTGGFLGRAISSYKAIGRPQCLSPSFQKELHGITRSASYPLLALG